MHQNSSVAPNPLGLTPILLFVVLVVVTGITTNDITAMPILVAFLSVQATDYALILKEKRLALHRKCKPFAKAVVIRTLFYWY